jgi:hypothetical protein
MPKGHYYRGKYPVKNREKYDGDSSIVVYRSLWERQVFRWCDDTPEVTRWSSEETVIPYRCRSDGKTHRYFVDLKIIFASGQTYLIEIKPKKQTQEPKVKTRKTRAYITEVLTYAKNISKWEAAREYCADRGWSFEVWTEDTIKGLGIKLLT